MNGTAVAPNTADHRRLATDVNSYRIGVVAQKLAMSAQNDDAQKFFHLCLSLARGIDYAIANNDPPNEASKLTPVLKQVCSRKKEFYLQSAIMVLMISVKNACKLEWFSAKETEELLNLADEVGNYFCTSRDINSETSGVMPTLSSVMSRYYPQYKLGHIISSFEVKPGYGTYLVDFHITKDLKISKDERIRLLMAMKDNVETSSCIISPQLVNILLNGRPVDKRTNVLMDKLPQAPTIVNHLLKYGPNLLQAVGRFDGHYILIIAAMSTLQISDLPAPIDYVQPDTILSEADSEIIEGASRISLNCPISHRRIKIPAKGHTCKHYQCFDLSNYVVINSKRPTWRCPHCNQSVNYTDLRVDRMMVKVLQEAGENVSEVTINTDGSWKVASSSVKDDSSDKTTNKQGEHQADESSAKSDGECNVFDLTEEDYEMDIIDVPEFVDKKPSVHHNFQDQPVFPNSPSQSNPRSANELFQYPFSQAANGLSSAVIDGNLGIAPVLTDAVTPSLNRQSNNFQGNNHPTSSSIGLSQPSPADSLQLQELFYGRSTIPRNVLVPSAIQPLPVQMPTPSSQQQHVRSMMSPPPAASGPSVAFQMPTFTQQFERQRQFQQPHINALHGSSTPTAFPQNRPSSQGVAMASPSYNSRVPQTSSQPSHLMLSTPPHQMRSRPPHLMRSSQLPRQHPQQGVSPGPAGPINSQSTVQRVHLPSQQAPSQVRPILPSQTHVARTSSSLPLNRGGMPQAVSRTENLIDLQQAEQSWRPTGRMRGALTGQAYSAALSQHMPGTGTPSPSPPVMAATSTPDNNLQVSLANQMIARATQMHNRSASDAPTNIENGGNTG